MRHHRYTLPEFITARYPGTCPAQEMEAKAAAILRRAGHIRQAVQWLEDQHNKKAA